MQKSAVPERPFQAEKKAPVSPFPSVLFLRYAFFGPAPGKASPGGPGKAHTPFSCLVSHMLSERPSGSAFLRQGP